MQIPVPPILRPAAQISPSVYEKMLRCKARAAWSLQGDRTAVPLHPKAILGTCYHKTVEDAHAGRIGGDPSARQAAAREAFDGHARRMHAGAHPLLRAKFAAPERLPYYNLFRERAVLEAMATVGTTLQSETTGSGALHLRATNVETRLASRDGLIAGRPDFIDVSGHRVVDYKTGAGPKPGAPRISEAEKRQLLLYAHLAAENGIVVTEGVISRSDGQTATIPISVDDAAAEGRAARRLLSEFNTAAGSDFAAAAQPAPDVCVHCPCIPFCEAFWARAQPDWADSCGIHVEGTVRTVEESIVQGMTIKTFGVSLNRGTVATGDSFVEQVPEIWIKADGGSSPVVGDLIRVTSARIDTDGPAASIRIDRVSTAIWSAPPVERADAAAAEAP